MTLCKRVERVSMTGKLQVPAHMLQLVGARPGQLMEFHIELRGSIRVAPKKELKLQRPPPGIVRKPSL